MRRSVMSPSADRMELRALPWLFTEKTTSNVVAGHPAGLCAWMPEHVGGKVVLATGKESSLPNVWRLDAFSGWPSAICGPARAAAFMAPLPPFGGISASPCKCRTNRHERRHGLKAASQTKSEWYRNRDRATLSRAHCVDQASPAS